MALKDKKAESIIKSLHSGGCLKFGFTTVGFYADNRGEFRSYKMVSYHEAKTDVKAQKDAVAANNREINTLNANCEKLTKSNQSNELEVQQLNHKITKATDDASEARKTVETMLEKYEWIAEERKFFGQSNTAYDFKATDPKEAAKRIQKLEGTKEKLGGEAYKKIAQMNKELKTYTLNKESSIKFTLY